MSEASARTTSAVGVLVVTHGPSAGALVTSLRQLLGEGGVTGVEPLAVDNGEPRPGIVSRLSAAVDRLDGGNGVLVLADLAGSTPANCAQELARAGRPVVVLCGVNLAMLVKVGSVDRAATSVQELARAAAETAARSIRYADGSEP